MKNDRSGRLADAWDVKSDGALCHLVERKGSGFTAEVRVWVEVEINGKRYEVERVMPMRLRRKR